MHITINLSVIKISKILKIDKIYDLNTQIINYTQRNKYFNCISWNIKKWDKYSSNHKNLLLKTI